MSAILPELLRKLEHSAWQHKGAAQRMDLRSGLRVDLLAVMDEGLHLQISREKVYPSSTEWGVVLRDGGWEVVGFPHLMSKAGRCYMRAKVVKL